MHPNVLTEDLVKARGAARRLAKEDEMQYLSTTLWWLAVAVLVVDLIHALVRSLGGALKLRQKISDEHWRNPNEYNGLYRLLYCGRFWGIWRFRLGFFSWKFKPFIFFMSLTLLGTVILFVLNPVFFWPMSVVRAVRRWWTKRNYVPSPPPLVYTNMVNGVLVVVRADNYERDKVWHEKAVLDGRVGQNDHVRVQPTFLFRHKAAKLDAEDMPFVSGWISDFQSEIALKCRVEERKDIYIPLASPHKKKREQDRKFLAQYSYDRQQAGVKRWIFGEG